MRSQTLVAVLAAESGATAVLYGMLGVAWTRKRTRVATLVAIAVAQGILGWLAEKPLADGALVTRLLLAAEALGALGVGALCGQILRDEVIASATTVMLLLLFVGGPVVVEALGPGGDVRSFGFAACPWFAAAMVRGIDVLHLPRMYPYAPAAVLEMHMTTWIVTALGWTGVGAVGVSSMARRRWFGGAAASLTLLAFLAVGCDKKDEQPQPTPAKTPVASSAPSSAPPKATPSSSAPAATAATSAAAGGPADLPATKAAIDKGLAFLVKIQGPDGMIGGHPGITAMVALALANSPDHPKADDPRLKPMLEALAKLAKPDGSIWDKDFQTYTTALSMLAFQAAGSHPEIVAKAQKWLADAQLDESEGVKPDNVNYGGIPYGVGKGNKGDDDDDTNKADLSNMQFALEALHESNFKDRPEVYARAVAFLSRTQNRSESNDQKWAGNDGGFVYRPGESKAGGTASAGAMTYAGLKSLIYADVKKDDPRVVAAFGWIKAHYSVDEHPGLGLKGLFYYYQEMARALALWGEPVITDSAGVKHDWYGELSRKIVSMQGADGSWKNSDATYREDNPVLATARALLALEYGYAAQGHK